MDIYQIKIKVYTTNMISLDTSIKLTYQVWRYSGLSLEHHDQINYAKVSEILNEILNSKWLNNRYLDKIVKLKFKYIIRNNWYIDCKVIEYLFSVFKFLNSTTDWNAGAFWSEGFQSFILLIVNNAVVGYELIFLTSWIQLRMSRDTRERFGKSCNIISIHASGFCNFIVQKQLQLQTKLL